MGEQRLDARLWAARFFKSCALPAVACNGDEVGIIERATKRRRAHRPTECERRQERNTRR